MTDQIACPNCAEPVDISQSESGMSTVLCPGCNVKFGLIVNAGGARAQRLPGSKGTTVAPRGVTAAQRSAALIRLETQVSARPTGTPPVTEASRRSQTIGATGPVGASGAASATQAPGKTQAPGATQAPRITPPPVNREPGGVGFAGTLAPSAGKSGIAGTAPPRPVQMGSLAPGSIAAAIKTEPAPVDVELTGTLGGYEIQKKLGQGGMGAVYLARQISLDRNVAIKVLSPQLAGNADFVARFTREAYAAAQLSHHNVVHIHDIGVERGTNFFSMEFVEGANLAQMVRKTGKLDPEAAVGYALQAARGLRFAHNHGLVHRDVKPDNLLLNQEGIVKVADLGLVKVAGTDDRPGAGGGAARSSGGSAIALSAAGSQTQFNVSMGTPEYMPPEQATDAANVDHRADIYSLGCTLYDLLTGQPPFTGRTVMEILTKHASGQPIPPDRVARHVSPALSTVVMKMTARKPADRYQTMDEVIAALEGYLGVDSGKPFSPTQNHVTILEAAVAQFNDAKWAKMRSLIIRGFFGVCAAATVICLVPGVGSPLLAGGLLGFALLTFVLYQITIGITRKTYLFSKLRQLVFGSSILDWLIYSVVTIALVAILVFFDLHLAWLVFGVAAGIVAAGFHFSIDRLVAAERETPLRETEAMLKDMRLRGLDENALRQFVCKYSGQHWEPMYEELFGYEAKLVARKAWGMGDRGKDRPKHGAWREAVIDWIDAKMRLRKEAREQKMLAKIEAKAIAAGGTDEKTAAQQARSAAQNMVARAAVIRESASQEATLTLMPGVSRVSRPYKIDWSAAAPAGASRSRLGRRIGSPVDWVLGRSFRFALAIILLLAVGMWWKSADAAGDATPPNGPIGTSLEQAADHLQHQSFSQQWQQLSSALTGPSNRSLRIPFVPNVICDCVGGVNGAVAAALLVLSLFFSGRGRATAALIGAAIALFGRLAVNRAAPTLPPIFGVPLLYAAVGAGITVLGIVVGRGK